MTTGINYESGLTLKQIASMVRRYAKVNYPAYKFSVTTHYASMCQELSVILRGGPCEVPHRHCTYLQTHYRFGADDDVANPAAAEAMSKVVNYAMSYNYDDSDVMTDYIDVNFYLFEGIASPARWIKSQ